MDEYDISAAFKAIEDELIASMMRNMARHRAEETREGICWSMWQAEQLKALEQYKRENQKKYRHKFCSVNKDIDRLLRKARETGSMEQEKKILDAIKKGFFPSRNPDALSGAFFHLNEQKLEALIQATVQDMEKAETAILRRANDQYRKAIFNAQVYANTGAGTYEKAVDMAVKDMLSAGLNGIVYANGAHHTLSDYADMAIRTAAKRAYLQGEGEKRKQWGITTVILAKRGNPCPKCLPFVGKIFIDDVWSGGKASDGNYPLLSMAVAAGLYHPRCKDSHTTYFPGISTAKDKWTDEELRAVGLANREEAKQQYAKRQAEKFGRLALYSLDGENQERYRKKAEEWQGQSDRDRIERWKGLFKHRNSSLEYIREQFIDAVEKNPNEYLQRAFRNAFRMVKIKQWDKLYSRFDELSGSIMLGKGADDKVIAHELFHQIDEQFGISKNRKLLKALVLDSEWIRKKSTGYGQSIFHMIQSQYPDEFELLDSGKMVIKKEHRGLSDIFHGLSHGEIDMGYGHRKKGYWEKPLNIEREVWAQMGRALYQNHPVDLEMLQVFLPNTYQRVLEILQEVGR